jgi:small-conductance mechanosensitive channel
VFACTALATGRLARAVATTAQDVIEEKQLALDGTANAITEGPVRARRRGLGDTGPTIKFAMKTTPGKMWVVEREMLRRIKNRFMRWEPRTQCRRKRSW